MVKKQQSEASNPAYYSTSNSAWNNMAVDPSCSLLNDSEKVNNSEGRQTQTAPVNLNNSSPQVNPVYIKKEEAFKLIIAARELVKNWKVPSSVTMRQYSAAMSRLRISRRMPEDYAQTKRGYYFYRAALIANALSVMQKRLATISCLQKKNDPEWLAASYALLKQLKILKRYPPDQEKTHLDAEVKGRFDASGKTPRSNSKRRGIGTLPANWRVVFWESFPEKSQHRLALAVLSATGCRPSELVKGVQIERDDHGDLLFSIKGTKTHNGLYGQQFRQLTIAPENEDARFLLKSVDEQAKTLTVFITNPKALTESIRRHSKKLWPKRKYVVSAYTFRHQLAADLKNDFSPAEIAMALGHSVSKTQKYYGLRHQGRAGTKLLNIKAEKDLFPDNTLKHPAISHKKDTPCC